MKTVETVSKRTRNNWLLDFALFTSGLLATVSGSYFLYLPNGGYEGGRNPYYNLRLLFDRHTWDDLHTWGGIAMILVALLHLIWHWPWVVTMTRRIWNMLHGEVGYMNARARWNLILNFTVALTFLLCAVSGLVLLIVPGGRGTAAETVLLLSRTSWDLVHTWSGIAFILTAVLHFAIHWKWVTKVSRKVFYLPQPPRRLAGWGSSAGE